MAKCRHPYSSQVKALPPCWVCLRCNARGVSSLGISNDSPPEVQIEIRAAEIAVSKDMMPSTVSSEELRGRMIAHGYNSTFTGDGPLSPGALAGYLSAIIEDDETAAVGWNWDPTRPVAGQYETDNTPTPSTDDAVAAEQADEVERTFTFGTGYMGDPAAWCFWETDTPQDGACGPFVTRGDAVAYALCTIEDTPLDDVLIAEQTRHDVAASVVRHAATEQPDAATAWSEYAAGNVKTVEEFETGRADLETDSVGNPLPKVAEWFAKHHGDDPTTVDSDDDVCPRCDSPKPHLHPAVQHGGDVHVCSDAFHCRVTPENTPDRIRANGLEPEGDDDPPIMPARDELPEETARAHARIEGAIAKGLEPGEGDPDWQAEVWAEIGGES